MGCGSSAEDKALRSANLQLVATNNARGNEEPGVTADMDDGKTISTDTDIPAFEEGPDGEVVWLENTDDNLIIVLDTFAMFNVPKMDLFSAADPKVVITHTGAKDWRYMSEARIDDQNPKWVLNLPLLIRNSQTDKIDIRIMDEDVDANDVIGRIVLYTHDLKARAGDNKKLDIKGTVELLEKGKKVASALNNGKTTFTASFHFEEWPKVFSVMGSLAGDRKTEASVDGFASLLVKAAKFNANGSKPLEMAELKGPTAVKKKYKTIELFDGVCTVLENDPDIPVPEGQVLFLKLLNSLPMKDTGLQFKSRSHAEAYMAKVFDGSFVQVQTEGKWDNVTSDESFTRYCFNNNGSPFVSRSEDGTYVVDVEYLRNYPIREGFYKWGGIAKFDSKAQPTSIDINDGKIYKPDEEGWEWAKLVMRSSLFPAMSGVHLMEVHYIWANYPNQAMLMNLSVDHPLRRLLHVHYYRSAHTITKSITTLLPNKGLVHRSTSLTHQGLQDQLADVLKKFKFHTIEEDLKEKNLENDENFPISIDGIELKNAIIDYVNEYVDIYYPEEKVLQADKDAKNFHAYMAKYMPGLPGFTLPELKTTLAECIWRVSGFHEHVGNVNTSGVSPVMVSPHLREGQLMNSVTSSLILAVISALTTGMIPSVDMKLYPALGDDFSKIMLDDKGRNCCEKFHRSMQALTVKIEERNQGRKFVFNDFNPKWVQTSVSG